MTCQTRGFYIMLRSVVTTMSDPLFRCSGSTPTISTDSPPPPSPPLGRSESSPSETKY